MHSKLTNGNPESFFQQPSHKEGVAVLDLLAEVLNSEDEQGAGSKAKTAALVVLSNLAVLAERRDLIFDAFRLMDGGFERLLKSKEQGKDRFGTSLGQFHPLVVILLMRTL